MAYEANRKRIAGEVEKLIAQYSDIAIACFKKQIKAFNGHMAKWDKVQQEIRNNPDSDSYYPNPTLWEIDDKLCCYYTTLALTHDAVKVKPPVHLSDDLDQEAAYLLHRYTSKAICPYGDDGLDTALNYVKADIQAKAKAKRKGKGDSGTSTKAGEEVCKHSKDYTSVFWYSEQYTFTATQAKCIEHLWKQWELHHGFGLREKTIGEAIFSDSDNYRLAHTFRTRGKMHQAWKMMIHSGGDGRFYLGKPPQDK